MLSTGICFFSLADCTATRCLQLVVDYWTYQLRYAINMGNKISRHRAIVDERYTRPQGLYEHKNVDQKKLRRLILDAKLAPCYPGTEDQLIDLDECPICLLSYPSLNRSKCCSKCICTECLLQMKATHSARSTQCPFCKMPNFTVEYRGAKTTEEKGIEQAEEQKVIEAKIRIRQRELKDEQEQVERQLENRKRGGFNIQSRKLRQNFLSSRRCSNSAATAEMAPGAFGSPLDSSPSLRTILEEGHPLIPEEEATTAEMAPGTFGRLFDSSPPLRTILEGEHSLIPEEEHHATLLSGRLMGRGWTLSQPADGSTSVRGQRENESGSSFIQSDGDYEFDLELEDIMVMEAIWLSIQEQNPQWQSSLSAYPGYMATSGFIDCAVDMELSVHESHDDIPPISAMEDVRDMPVRSLVTGGLASALAVLAERQIQSIDSAGPVQVQDSSETCHENFVPSINNCVRNADRSVSVVGDAPKGKDIAEVSSAYGSPTRCNTHLDKGCIYKEGNVINSAFESDSEAEGREVLAWQESDGNERLDSWIEVSLDSRRVSSTV